MQQTTETASPPMSRCKKITIITIVTIVVAILIWANIYFSYLYKDLYDITEKIINANNLTSYIILGVFNIGFQMLFLPGISIFIVYIGFITKSYFQTMLFIYPSTLLIVVLSYYLANYTIKKWLYTKLKHKWYFNLYYMKSQEEPLKTSWMLRILLIPATYKNYLISLMNIDFKNYFIPAVIHYYPYFSCYAIIGVSISTIDEAINGNVPTENKPAFFTFLGFMVLMLVLSIAVIIYFTVLTIRMFKEHRKEMEERKANSVSDHEEGLINKEEIKA